MLQEAFRNNVMSQNKTFLWYKCFKDGRTSVDNDEHSGRPSTNTSPENVAKVHEAILADRRQTIHDVCEIVRLSYGTIQHILVDNLNMRRISARFVPRLLSNDQKALRVSVCREFKQQPVMKHGCMVMTLRLSSSRHSGSHQIHHGPKKVVKFAAMWSPCWSVLSTSKALTTGNLYPLVKPSMANFTMRFWSAWGRALGANVQTSGRKTNGFSTMKTRPFTHHLFDSSWIPKTLQWFPTPLFTWPVTFSYSPRWNYSWKDFVLTQLGRSTHKMQEVIDTLTSENFQGCMKSWETCWDHWYMLKRDYFEGDSGK